MDNTEKEIRLNTEAGAFFTEDVWDRGHLALVQDLTYKLMNIFSEGLSEYHGIPVRDSFHLSKEMSYTVTSIHLDTFYRLKKGLLNGHKVSGPGDDFSAGWERFFCDSTTKLSLVSSLTLRVRIADIIMSSLGCKKMITDTSAEPQSINLQEAGLNPGNSQGIWLLRYYLSKIPDKSDSFIRIFLNRLKQKTRMDEIATVGYIAIDKKYMFQLPDINFVKLDINLKDYNQPVEINLRKELFDGLWEGFFRKAEKQQEWLQFLGFPGSPEFLKTLLATVVLFTEPLLCNKEQLKGALEYCKGRIKEKKVAALFSVGGWTYFDNAVIAAAGRAMDIPIIEYQFGGRPIMVGGRFMDADQFTPIDYYLVWGGLRDDSAKSVTPKFIKVADPHLNYMHHRGKKAKRRQHSRIKKDFKILYSPIGLSYPFRVENWFSFGSDQVKRHRQLISEVLERIDRDPTFTNTKLFVKIKGFGYSLYKNYEYMLLPKIELKNIPVEYLLKANSQNYFDFVDVHLFDGLSTTLIQSFAYNIPSVIFWNKEVLGFFPEYQGLADRLIKEGIIVSNPQAACDSLRRIYNDRKWWFSEATQGLVREYLNTFGYFNNNWITELNSVIKNVICGKMEEL